MRMKHMMIVLKNGIHVGGRQWERNGQWFVFPNWKVGNELINPTDMDVTRNVEEDEEDREEVGLDANSMVLKERK